MRMTSPSATAIRSSRPDGARAPRMQVGRSHNHRRGEGRVLSSRNRRRRKESRAPWHGRHSAPRDVPGVALRREHRFKVNDNYRTNETTSPRDSSARRLERCPRSFDLDPKVKQSSGRRFYGWHLRRAGRQTGLRPGARFSRADRQREAAAGGGPIGFPRSPDGATTKGEHSFATVS